MEFILDGIMYLIVSFLDLVIPALNLPPNFIAQIDNAVSYVITLIYSMGYFIPLDIFVMCFSVRIIVDLFSLTLQCAKWVVGIIRG